MGYHEKPSAPSNLQLPVPVRIPKATDVVDGEFVFEDPLAGVQLIQYDTPTHRMYELQIPLYVAVTVGSWTEVVAKWLERMARMVREGKW